jgi:hypothetical protein
MNLYRFLADLVVVVHFAYIAFVVVGFLLILLGIVLGWGWVRNFWFRVVHFLAIFVVAAEALGGVTCPLTTWEGDLRRAAGETVHEGSFIGRWAHEIVFIEEQKPPEWVFTLCYCLFAAAVAATLLLAPPRGPRRRSGEARRAEGDGE